MNLHFPTVTGAKVIQGFGNWNPQMYPGGRHMGIDIMGTVGTPIFAVCAGVVATVSLINRYGYGRHIIIEHGDFKTLYAHQHKILVSEGQAVEAGAQIGEMGGDPTDGDPIDGASTGPHLHFEVILPSQPDMDNVKTVLGWTVDGFAYLLKRFTLQPIATGKITERTGVRVRPEPTNVPSNNYFDSFSFGKVFEIAETKDDGRGTVWARVRSLRTEWVCVEYQNRKYAEITPMQKAEGGTQNTGSGEQKAVPQGDDKSGTLNEWAIRADELQRLLDYVLKRKSELQ